MGIKATGNRPKKGFDKDGKFHIPVTLQDKKRARNVISLDSQDGMMPLNSGNVDDRRSPSPVKKQRLSLPATKSRHFPQLDVLPSKPTPSSLDKELSSRGLIAPERIEMFADSFKRTPDLTYTLLDEFKTTVRVPGEQNKKPKGLVQSFNPRPRPEGKPLNKTAEFSLSSVYIRDLRYVGPGLTCIVNDKITFKKSEYIASFPITEGDKIQVLDRLLCNERSDRSALGMAKIGI